MNNILALDIGFKSTGYSVWNNDRIIATGVIRTKASKTKIPQAVDYSQRSMVMACGLDDICCEYDIKAIVGEMPHGGAQSFRAGAMMSMANAVISATVALLDIPHMWTTPNKVKIAVTGNKQADKKEMMIAVAKRYGTYSPEEQKKYYIAGKFYNADKFEHIADSVGAYLALQNEDIIINNKGE